MSVARLFVAMVLQYDRSKAFAQTSGDSEIVREVHVLVAYA